MKEEKPKQVELTEKEKKTIQIKNWKDEIRYKEEDLKNRKDTIEWCDKELKNFKRQRDLIRDELKVEVGGYRIIKSNPLKYEQTDAWGDHIKKTADLKLKGVPSRLTAAMSEIERKKLPIVEQRQRCVGDVPDLKKRLTRLKGYLARNK